MWFNTNQTDVHATHGHAPLANPVSATRINREFGLRSEIERGLRDEIRELQTRLHDALRSANEARREPPGNREALAEERQAMMNQIKSLQEDNLQLNRKAQSAHAEREKAVKELLAARSRIDTLEAELKRAREQAPGLRLPAHLPVPSPAPVSASPAAARPRQPIPHTVAQIPLQPVEESWVSIIADGVRQLFGSAGEADTGAGAWEGSGGGQGRQGQGGVPAPANHQQQQRQQDKSSVQRPPSQKGPRHRRDYGSALHGADAENIAVLM